MVEITRKQVIPGDVIITGDYRPGMFVQRRGTEMVALRIGLAEIVRNDVKVIPLSGAYMPRVHPSILRDAVQELRTAGYKSNKGLSLRSNLDNVSYKLIRKGFMFASQDDKRFYPIPSLAEIEKRNLKFWRSL